MVLRSVSKYSLVNAKVRSRLSRLLDPAAINRLAETRDLAEFYAALGGTVYEPVFGKPEIAFDPRVGEKFLVEQEIDWHSELLKDLKKAEKDLVAHFLEKYEIENLKACLRIREGKKGTEDMKYLVRRSLPHALPYQAISESKSMEEALACLQGTPFLKPANDAYDDYKKRGTLFPVEIRLEVDYYERLQVKIGALSKKDAEAARRLIGLEIDRNNLAWLIRLKFYYDIPVGELLDYNIPGGYRIKRDKLRKAFKAETIKDVLSAALDRGFQKASELILRGEDLSKLYLLEIILWNYQIAEARRTLAGFPFTIGTVLSYLILKRTEVRNLMTILNGKVYKMGREEIESHLRVSF